MARACVWCALDPCLTSAKKDSAAIRSGRLARLAPCALLPCSAGWSPHCLLWRGTCPGALPPYSPCAMCTLVARGVNLVYEDVATPPATLEPHVTYAVRGMCPARAAPCGVLPGRPGLICSGASTPCSMCPDISVCSSIPLLTVCGGASSYQHLSRGEALWYTTCALLALLCQTRAWGRTFSFSQLSHLPRPLLLRNVVLALLPPRSTQPDPQCVNLCSLLPLSRGLCTMSSFVSPLLTDASTAWLMIPM